MKVLSGSTPVLTQSTKNNYVYTQHNIPFPDAPTPAIQKQMSFNQNYLDGRVDEYHLNKSKNQDMQNNDLQLSRQVRAHSLVGIDSSTQRSSQMLSSPVFQRRATPLSPRDDTAQNNSLPLRQHSFLSMNNQTDNSNSFSIPNLAPSNLSRQHSTKSTKSVRKEMNSTPVGISRTKDSEPPRETTSYQGLDLTSFASNIRRRLPRRRAVIVGVNYVSTPDILLRGCCNDASALALILINLCDFLAEDIILLIDAFPAQCYRKSPAPEGESSGNFVPWKNKQPTRRNILLAMNWLRSNTQPGDVLLFYFAGHGIQVDDMSGWEGEGYDEAVLPMDFCGDEINAITAVMIRNVLLNVANDVQVSIILDCNGGQTMLDPSGTGKWNFIKGVKQRGVWPFVTDATDKVARAVYDPSPWTDKAMKKRGARPRFIPGVDVNSTQELLDPVLQKPNLHIVNKVKGYLFAAAPWSQSAIEVKMSAIRLSPIDCNGNLLKERTSDKSTAYHGVFSWCFMTALQELMIQAVCKSHTKRVSYRHLAADIERRVKACKSPQGGLPKLNQLPELTFYRSGGSNPRDYFLWPFGGRCTKVPYADEASLKDIKLPNFPHEQQYLSTWDAEEQLHKVGENQRRNDPAFILRSNTMTSQNGSQPQRLLSEHQLPRQFTSASMRCATPVRQVTSPRLPTYTQNNEGELFRLPSLGGNLSPTQTLRSNNENSYTKEVPLTPSPKLQSQISLVNNMSQPKEVEKFIFNPGMIKVQDNIMTPFPIGQSMYRPINTNGSASVGNVTVTTQYKPIGTDASMTGRSSISSYIAGSTPTLPASRYSPGTGFPQQYTSGGSTLTDLTTLHHFNQPTLIQDLKQSSSMITASSTGLRPNGGLEIKRTTTRR